MTNRIFKSILLTAVVVLFSSMIIFTAVLYDYYTGIQINQLKDELSLAAKGVEKVGIDYLKDLGKDEYRLTLVKADGTVLYDSYTNPLNMENHADRKEIGEALAYGNGSSSRYSITLTEQTLYEATRLNDGMVLRISISTATVVLLLLSMIQPIAIVLVVSIVLSIILAKTMAKHIVEPLNELDLEHPLNNDTYEELSPLLHRINVQHNEIESKMHELRRMRDEFINITNNMKEALIILDNNECILAINSSARALFKTQDDCIGKDILTLDRHYLMRKALDEVKTKSHASFRYKIDVHDYQFDLNQIISSSQKDGIVILAYDISEQVNAERNRQEFTANVSHELKTPLQSIIGSAELLENGIVKEEDVARFTSHIREEAQRLVLLIDDIIGLSEIEEGIDMQKEDISLKSLTEDIFKTLKDSASKKKINLKLNGEANLYGVKRLLYEIIYNLVDNSIKYGKNGGYVEVDIQEKEDDITLKVKDNGIGIPSTDLTKVFERFYRVDKSHSKKSGGTGLGLSIVKRAVQYHHGTVDIISEVYKGTTITISFNKEELK